MTRPAFGSLALMTVAAALCLAQEPEPQPRSSGWRRLGEPGPPAATASPQSSSAAPQSQLILPAGAWITVRVNEPLSSDQNRPGDGFSATLAQPLVADGLVIARRGQTVGGRVAEAQKAGRAKGTSRLAIEITEITLADGQLLPLRTQLVEYSGGTSVGRDATAVATTTGVGAAIGAAADGGFGAGMGAIAGAGASIVGVLITRGRPTVVLPEATLSFRTLAPLTVSTERAPQAFQSVSQQDYEPRPLQRRAVSRPTLYPPPYYNYPGYYWGYPYFYGPSFGFFYSRPVYFHHRGFRRW